MRAREFREPAGSRRTPGGSGRRMIENIGYAGA